jgi:hypothetical protein
MKTLRIGSTSFESIRENGDYYADKTEFLYELAKKPEAYFLARPPRFGKTLLLDTLGCILKGQRHLFKGLWINTANYDWATYPVIRLDMGKVVGNDAATMVKRISGLLADMASLENLPLPESNPSDMLRSFVLSLFAKYKKSVAILIDEYDAPILEHIQEPTKAQGFLNAFSDFYGTLKTCAGLIGHVFITGITRFKKSTIFSKFVLKDLTVDRKFSAICGLTVPDMENLLFDYQQNTLNSLRGRGVIAPRSTVDDLRQLIHDWYDGYSFDGEISVFNPCSLLNFIDKAEFNNSCYRSGNPSFLKKLIDSGKFDYDWTCEMRKIKDSQNVIDLLSSIKPSVLLFHTGYLTIQKSQPIVGKYSKYNLTIPNLEVKQAFVPLLLPIGEPSNPYLAQVCAKKMWDHIFTKDITALQDSFGNYLSQFSNDKHIPEEKFYYALLVSSLKMANLHIWFHDHTEHGIHYTHIKDTTNTLFIVEISHVQENNTPQRTPNLLLSANEKAKLREKMSQLAKDSFIKINERYAKTNFFDKGAIKVALIVARQSFVHVQFEEIQKTR